MSDIQSPNTTESRETSAVVILQLLDHLRGMAQMDGHQELAGVLDEAYARCASLNAAETRSPMAGIDRSRMQ